MPIYKVVIVEEIDYSYTVKANSPAEAEVAAEESHESLVDYADTIPLGEPLSDTAEVIDRNASCPCGAVVESVIAVVN